MMLDLKAIYTTESVEDVLLHFAPRVQYGNIDKLYVRYKFEVIASGSLIETYQKLIKEGKLVESINSLPEKGPNWKEPKFVIDKKYVIS